MATITIGRKLSYLTDSVTAAQGPSGGQAWLSAEQNQLVPSAYDYIGLTYHPTFTDQVATAVYKIGGAAGVTVATLSLSYDATGNLTAVHRS